MLQNIHYLTSLLMLISTSVSLYIKQYNKNDNKILNLGFEVTAALVIIMIAVLRITFFQEGVFYLSSIYVASLYGLAIFITLNYKLSFIIYLASSVFFAVMLYNYRPLLNFNRAVSDIAVNNLIAWIISIINYSRSVAEYNQLKLIEDNYLHLDKRNKKMNRMNSKLKSKSITDELTKLYNRREIESNLDYLYIDAKKNKHKKFSVILCDLDDFSQINNNYGHLTGDNILVEVSKILRKNIRDSDICGRWGGEEFLILCPNATIQEAYNLAERLRKSVEAGKYGEVSKVTASFGAASFSPNLSIEQLIQKADDRLYKAKERGKNQVAVR